MANQLGMDKVHAIKCLRQSGLSERKIALQLGISRKAVRRHLSLLSAKDTKAPTGEALTGSSDSKDTRALTGTTSPETPSKSQRNSPSTCAPFQAFILEKLALGFSAQRIYQDLVDEHGFNAKYHSVRRYVAKLSQSTEPPFRRIECEPGAEMQVDFGTGARCQDQSGAWRKTHVFRAVLSHSRKGYSEAVRELTIERFIQVLENAFWRLGGVPRVVIFDNGSCAVKHAD